MRWIVASLLCFTTVFAQAVEEDELGLHNESELGYIVVGGNAKSESFSAKQDTWYQWKKDLARFKAAYLNTSAQVTDNTTTPPTTSEQRTAENWSTTLRWEHIVSKKFNTYTEAGLLKDHFRGIDLAQSYGLGGKYYWLKDKGLEFFSELGYQYLKEDLDVTLTQPNLYREAHFVRVYTQIDYSYTKSTKVSLYVEYLPDLKDSENYRVNFGPSLVAILNDTFSIKFSYDGKYRNIPAIAFGEYLDFSHTTSLVAKF